MTLIDKKQLLSDIVNLKMPLSISSQGVDATYMDGYWEGKKQRESEIIDIINKQRVAELEKPKKKRKFRAMTNSEFWRTYVSGENFCCRNCSLCRHTDICELAQNWNSISKKPYKTKDGKYILIEVKE